MNSVAQWTRTSGGCDRNERESRARHRQRRRKYNDMQIKQPRNNNSRGCVWLMVMVRRAVPGEREGRTSVEPAAPAPSSSSSSNSRFSSSPGARIFLVTRKVLGGVKDTVISICHLMDAYLMVAIQCTDKIYLKGTGWTSNGNSLL